MDLWIHHQDSSYVSLASGDHNMLMPYYVSSAATVLMAFRWRSMRRADGHTSHDPVTQPPSYFLAETSNASVAYFEETGESVGDQDEKTDA